VLEGRHFRALGMAALLRLFQLLRVAEEDDALGGLRDRKDVRKRHLPGLIHEEHVDGIAAIRARPHPDGAGRHLSLANGVQPRRAAASDTSGSLGPQDLIQPLDHVGHLFGRSARDLATNTVGRQCPYLTDLDP